VNTKHSKREFVEFSLIKPLSNTFLFFNEGQVNIINRCLNSRFYLAELHHFFWCFLATQGQRLVPGIEPLTVESLRSNSKPSITISYFENSTNPNSVDRRTRLMNRLVEQMNSSNYELLEWTNSMNYKLAEQPEPNPRAQFDALVRSTRCIQRVRIRRVIVLFPYH